MVAFSLEIGFPPFVEELSFYFLVDVISNQVLVLVVFVYEIHSLSIPFSQSCPSALSVIVFFDFYKLSYAFLELYHILCTILDLLNGIFCAHIQSLSQNLKE